MSSVSPAVVLDLDLSPGRPPVLRAEVPGGATAWAAEHRTALRAAVLEHGALLVRGLGLRDAAEAGAVFTRLTDGLMTEQESFAPREAYADGVYASTKWPANQPMCMHHELSYALQVPSLQLFCCLTPPVEGGATELADGTAVLDDLPADLVERFGRVGWELSRTHNEVIGINWPEAFGTDDRDVIERYCAVNDIRPTWLADGELRTRRVRPAIIRHPLTGARVWFNQVAFLNEWTMQPAVREYLVSAFGADRLPYNTRFGDGGLLDKDTVDGINDVYLAHTVRREWQAGDVLVVDNLRMAHSRAPFQGDRNVLVALAEPIHIGQLVV